MLNKFWPTGFLLPFLFSVLFVFPQDNVFKNMLSWRLPSWSAWTVQIALRKGKIKNLGGWRCVWTFRMSFFLLFMRPCTCWHILICKYIYHNQSWIQNYYIHCFICHILNHVNLYKEIEKRCVHSIAVKCLAIAIQRPHIK